MGDDSRVIGEKYDQIAPWYDRVQPFMEWLGIRKLRRNLLRHASGRVLAVAAGTGEDFRHLPREARVTAVDLSIEMLRIAGPRAGRLGLRADRIVMDAELLGFPDGAFDTVISTLALCTYRDPVSALRELARVCRPGGRILLLEHGRSDRGRLARWQDQRAERHAQWLGCHWNREPLDLARQSGLRVLRSSRHFLGIFHVIEAAPA